MSQKTETIHSTILVFLLISCYFSSINASWHFDDFPNIINNYPLHINHFSIEGIWDTLFAKPFQEGSLFRPISNLSFAFNWFSFKRSTPAYHITNILIHAVSTIFLFKSTIILLSTFTGKQSQKAYTIALISSAVWAANPIQTQAVTYIVQRMASMAGMFYICSLYSYLKARQPRNLQKKTFYFATSLFCFLLAMGCKENAITLIPTLFAVEYFFPQTQNNKFSKIAFRATLIATLCFFAAGVYFIVDHNLLDYLNKPIGSRPFSIGERLLTQPSILLFYLSLILLPSPARLSIDHSFPLSTSLWHPWTTLPAIIFCLGLIIFALSQRNKRPLVGFAILFFFINHLVESTVIPLEMIFEHRNYLPSMFLFLPVAAGIHTAIDKTKRTNKLIYATLLAALPVILIGLGLGTYSRNQVWATEESLWADALTKAPTNARPYAKLGEIYGWQKEKNAENLTKAVALLEKAQLLNSPRTSFKAAVVDNIGKVYFNYGLIDLAIENYQRSLDINPNFITSRFDLAKAFTLKGNFNLALDQIEQVITKNDLQSRFFNLKALLLLWLDRPKEAAVASSQAIHRTLVNKERYFYICGVSLTRAGHLEQGYWFLRQGLIFSPSDKRILYSLIENRKLAMDSAKITTYAQKLVQLYSLPEINADFERIPKDYGSVPVDIEGITPVIFHTAQQALTTFKQD